MPRGHTKAGANSAVTGALADVLGAINNVSDYEIQNRFTGDDPDVISTGYVTLDKVTKIGGLPCGQVVQVYGPPSQFKSGFAMHMTAQLQEQRPDGIPVYVDTEGSYTHSRARAHGVDTDKVILIQGNTAEEKFNQIIAALDTGKVSGIIFDSWGALIESGVTRGDENQFEKQPDGTFKQKRMVASIPRLTTQFLQTIVEKLLIHKPLFLIVDQNRVKIPTGGKPIYGDPSKRTGGEYKAYSVVMEIRLRVVEFVKSVPQSDPDGVKVAFTMTKNKYGPTSATVDATHPTFWFGDGPRALGRVQELFNRLIMYEVLRQDGAWYSWIVRGETRKKWQGKANAFRELQEDTELREKLENILATKEKLGGHTTGVSSEPATESDDVEVPEE